MPVSVQSGIRNSFLPGLEVVEAEARAHSGSVPVCIKLATDLSLKASYSEPWTMARILNETGLRAVLNYAARIALARMPQRHTLALNQFGEDDRDFQKPKSGQRLRRHLSQKELRIN